MKTTPTGSKSPTPESFRCGALRITTAPMWRWELWHESGERENETVLLAGRAELDPLNDTLWLHRHDTRSRGEFGTMREVEGMLSRLPRWTATKRIWQMDTGTLLESASL